jgi:ABC-type sugar transport system ATPase subunit
VSENLVLEMRSITKRFPGVLALDGVEFHCQKSSIHALVGERCWEINFDENTRGCLSA